MNCRKIFLVWLLVLAGLSTAIAADYNFSGRVIDDATNQPLSGATVTLRRPHLYGPIFVTATTSALDGAFTLSTNSGGTFELDVRLSGYVTRSRIPLGPFSAPTTINDIELRIIRAGVLVVRVVDAVSGAPLENVQVVTERDSRRQTDAEGGALFTGLVPGDYRVCVVDFEIEHLNVCLEGHLLGFAESLGGPTLAVVGGENTVVDMLLPKGGAIAGRIDDGHAGRALPYTYLNFSLYDMGGALLRDRVVRTDANGSYRLPGLPTGNYLLGIDDLGTPFYFRNALYRNVLCSTTCPFGEGTPIAAVAGVTTPGIDFSLTPAAIAAGRITDANTGAPLSGVRVVPYSNTNFGWMLWGNQVATTDADGRYELAYLPTTFDVRLGTRGASGYVNLAWPNTPCGYDNCGGGTSLRLNLGETRGGFDFALTPGPGIRGRTVALDSERPVSALVNIYNSARKVVWSGTSDATGQYGSSPLPVGSYYPRATLGNPDWACSWYGDAACDGDLYPTDFSAAASVATDGVNELVDIDIGLRTIEILVDGFE